MRIPLAREGIPFIAVPATLAVGLWLAGMPVVASAFSLAALACAAFFRDPERQVPSDASAILAPADGKIVAVESDRGSTRISIFLSLFDVHVNRAPVSAQVGAVHHTPGRFLAAFDPRASEINEQTAIPLEAEHGRVVVKQIAGILARRIVCRVREGDRLKAGERFGLIRFGSRTDLLLPPEAQPIARLGDHVRGGATVVARWTEEARSRQ